MDNHQLRLAKLAEAMPSNVAQDLLSAPKSVQLAILRAYRQNPDQSGKRWLEIYSSPLRGNSRKYPYR